MTAVPFIRAEDVEHRLDWLHMADAIAAGHRGKQPVISDQMLRRDGDILLSRAAWIDGLGVAVKSVTVLPGNPAKGLPSVHGAIVLFDDATGEVEAVIDSGLVTKWKTAADSILGARFLARRDSKRLLVVGAGVVARSLIDAYRVLFADITISIWNRTPDKARELADATGTSFVDDLAKAVAQADIISTATMAREPIIRGEWLQPGTHLDLIGAFTPDMREADDAAMRKAKIFVDCRETTIDHIGELMIPIRNNVIARSDVLGDLRDLASGTPGRVSNSDITLFKNGGGAHLDLMVGKVILAAWKQVQ